MRNKVIFYIILIFVIVTAQVTVVTNLDKLGICPNLSIILIVSISLLKGRVDGAIIGFFTGLCLDSVVGIALGYHALIGLLLGFSIGNINKRFYKENIFVMVICTFFSTILFEEAILFAAYLYGVKADFILTLKESILPEAVVNSIFGIVLFLLIVPISKRVIGVESKTKY